ncbi:MAG: hypothetical protein GQ547_04620 [Methylophaga sp.]|nr:hypothetical protein [Methylophaga sp.]
MKNPKFISIFLGTFILIIASLLIYNNLNTSKSSTTIYPLESVSSESEEEYSLPERQRVALYLRESDLLETVTIRNDRISFASDIWEVKESENSRISKLIDDQLYISYQGSTVFSTHDLIYDYIKFNTVCTGLDKRQQLLFSMVRGGTANGEVQDMLFVFHDSESQTFQHKVIERRYLPDVCEMESAEANKAEQEQLLEEINLIYETLRPSITDTYPDEYVTSQHALPTRQFSKAKIEEILTEFKQFMPVIIENESEAIINEDEVGDEYPDFYEPEFMIEDLAENTNWRIVEVLYLQLYASWGVLLAENKNTGQWTSFYTVSSGDSKQHLYFDDDVELVDGELIGTFTAYGDQKMAISLDDFLVRRL